ncbi:hypothetical protein RBH26_09880 [Natronolimnohabitans sp. A-GB9]|uniref:hypothetical protein n=1 Tax=Natronolimnohabitans sp. A-GB9 TaxID=3069757 RepID=UPI0027AEC542|nr:hypothetical protein [Natronolimnohabitans sp. A-GB9]MDQ2050794.1 hypothetical protein [Natronolimnohabitans sp. A-GB9]
MSKLASQPNNATGISGSLDAVYERTEDCLERAIKSFDSKIVEGPPGGGKTTTAFKIASRSSEAFVYLTKREDLYEQGERLSDEFDLSHEIIPSPHRDCPSFDEDSPQFDPEAKSLYDFGVNAARIHAELDLDCSPNCEYMQKWETFDDDPADIIIGHYKHAYLSSLIEDRIVIIDEFPGGAFEREFNNADAMISRFLRSVDRIPFDDFLDLIENRDDLDRVKAVYAWFRRNGVGTDDRTIIEANENDRYHTLAPFLTYTVLNTIKNGNGFEVPWFNLTGIEAGFEESSPFSGLETERLAAVDREQQSIHVLTPPDLSGARGVVGLDGTPTPMMWELATGEDFDHLSVLDREKEMSAYVRDFLGVTVKQTNEHLKPYHGGHITENRDEAILYGVEVKEGQKPALIAPEKALEAYREAGILDRTGLSMNYAQVLSSNDFKGEPVGVIHGAPHPGNQPVKKWAAYFGIPVDGEGEGMNKTYGEFGDEIYRHFVHNQVLQAILRFGRGESDATVYVNTAAIPDDSIEVDSMANPELFNSPNKRKIADHLRDAGADGATKKDLKKTAEIESMTTVENILYDFRDKGLVEDEVVPGPYPTVYRWSR